MNLTEHRLRIAELLAAIETDIADCAVERYLLLGEQRLLDQLDADAVDASVAPPPITQRSIDEDAAKKILDREWK